MSDVGVRDLTLPRSRPSTSAPFPGPLRSHLPVGGLDGRSRSRNLSHRWPECVLETPAAVLPGQAFLIWLNGSVALGRGGASCQTGLSGVHSRALCLDCMACTANANGISLESGFQPWRPGQPLGRDAAPGAPWSSSSHDTTMVMRSASSSPARSGRCRGQCAGRTLQGGERQVLAV